MMTMTEKKPVNCTVCDSSTHEILFEPWVDVTDPAKLYGAASGIQGTQQIVRCKDCGMIYESPRYPESVILKGYASSNEAGHDSQYPMRVKSFLSALRKLSPQLPPPGAKILDIGTAGGAFLEAATQYGYDAHGMEPSQYLVESGKKRGLQIEQGTIEAHRFGAGEFDMVCLWDVIEHLCDPRRDLALIRPLLKKDGILLINYPDIGTWAAKVAGKKFWWILSVHLHHFDQKSLGQLCRKTGFDPVLFKSYWQILEFGYLEGIAAHLGVPLAAPIKKVTPQFIQKFEIPYWASQTTCLARLA